MKKSSTLTRTLGIIAVIVVSLCAVSVALAATQLLTNGDFSTNFLIDNTWSENPGIFQPGIVTYNSTTGHIAPGSAQLDVDVAQTAEISQCVNLSGLPALPSMVTVTAYYLAPALANSGVYLNIDSYSDTSCTVNGTTAYQSSITPGTGVWAPIGIDHLDLTSGDVITPVRSMKVTLGIIELDDVAQTAYFDDASAYVASDNGTPNAVTLNNLDAKQANEPSPIWLALIALPLALGAGALVMRRRRA